jgi:hypothetical protein
VRVLRKIVRNKESIRGDFLKSSKSEMALTRHYSACWV